MMGFAIVCLSCLGLGVAVMPASFVFRWLGTAYLTGLALIVLGLFFGNVVAGIPLHLTAWAVLGVAALGGAARLWRGGRAAAYRTLILHPVIILPATIFVLALVTHRFAYMPYLYDEFTNWIGWAQQMVVADHFATSDMAVFSVILSYPPGWPLLMAYPGAVLGIFRVADGASIPFLIHVGLLGIAYDVVCWHWRRVGNDNERLRRLIGWCAILLLLLVEAGWKLVPTLLLIEKPQIYPLAALLLLGWLLQQENTPRRQLAYAMGLILAALYLIKIATVVFVPAAVLLAAGGAYRVSRNDGILPAVGLVAAVLLPLAAIMIVWPFFQPGPAVSCLSSVGSTLSLETLTLLGSARSEELIVRLSGKLWVYVSTFKPWLTVIGLIGVATTFADRRTAVVGAALLGYAALYVFGMYWMYLTCFSGYHYDILISHQRFIRVALRVLHVIGPMALMLWLLGLAPVKNLVARAGRGVPWAAALTAVIVLAGWQGVQAERSLRDMDTRELQPGRKYISFLRQLHREYSLMLAVLSERPMQKHKVMILDQGGNSRVFPPVHLMRLGHERGAALKRIEIERRTSLGEEPVNIWMTKSTPEELRRLVLSVHLLWPVVVDDWARSALAPLIKDRECRKTPERYFLIPEQHRTLRCVAKITAGN